MASRPYFSSTRLHRLLTNGCASYWGAELRFHVHAYLWLHRLASRYGRAERVLSSFLPARSPFRIWPLFAALTSQVTTRASAGNPERICDRPYVDHRTKSHNSLEDNVGPDLWGFGGWGLRSGPCSV
jgi:hypothetical protein